MTNRYLIVNADDFNTDPPRSRGILDAAARGIVTSTTALANLPWRQDTAAKLMDQFGTGIGIHLNLTKGSPLTGNTTSLVDEKGVFLPKHRAWRRALLHGYDTTEVEREFAAQIKKLVDLGLQPSHLDGNNHIHVFPGMAAIVVRLAKHFGIRSIRLPRERAWQSSWRGAGKRHFINLLSRQAARLFSEAGVFFPDDFAGIQFPRPGHIPDLLAFLKALPPGITELMCHPGYSEEHPDGSFSTATREEELTALCHPDALALVKQEGIDLVNYAMISAIREGNVSIK